METHNKFFVSLHGDNIVILQPPTLKPKPLRFGFVDHDKKIAAMTRNDALLLAAWIVACADPGGTQFMALLASIKGDV